MGNQRQGLLLEVENFLNALMYGNKVEGQIIDEKAQKEFEKRVLKVFQEKYSSFGINFSKGLQVYYKGNTEVTNKTKISRKKLQSYLDTVSNMINESVATQDGFDANYARQIQQELINYMNIHAAEGSSLNANKDLKNLLNKLNEVLKMQSIPYAQAIGDVFEYWLAIASQYADQYSDKQINEIIDQFVRGQDRSNVIISGDNFDNNLVDLGAILGADNGKWQRMDDSNSFMLQSPTQDKLDVIFKWQNDDVLDISAKNYSFSKSDNIHLLSGSSLLYLVSNENSDFVNHWLNCISEGSDLSKINSSLIEEAHRTMKITLLTQALMGTKGNLANTFVLNDRKNQKIYVRDLASIIYNICKDQKIEGMNITNYPQSLSNSWEGNLEISDPTLARVRITNLLAQLHQAKISVSIKGEAVRANGI